VDELQQRINEVRNRLLQLSRGWVVDPDANIDREKRIASARNILQWLGEDAGAVYSRVYALQQSLAIREGDELELADCGEIVSKRHGDPLPGQLRGFLHRWATVDVPKRWEETTSVREDGAPWPDAGELNSFVRYLRDYLLTEDVLGELSRQLGPVVNLKTKDEAARRRARRKYVRIIVNDFILNPGPSMTPMQAAELAEQPETPQDDVERFGLMASFVARWASRLPEALARGAGEHVNIPPGNGELVKILDPFEK
jgi:hypothetical protein